MNKAKTRVYLPSSITRGSREIEWNHQGQTEQNMKVKVLNLTGLTHYLLH